MIRGILSLRQSPERYHELRLDTAPWPALVLPYLAVSLETLFPFTSEASPTV